jgi:molecular chaperone DnaK
VLTSSRPFKVVPKSDGRPAVQVENGGKVQVYSPEELSSFVLVKMKDTAEQYLNKKIRYVITLFSDGLRSIPI